MMSVVIKTEKGKIEMSWGTLSFNKIPIERERPKTKRSLDALWQGGLCGIFRRAPAVLYLASFPRPVFPSWK